MGTLWATLQPPSDCTTAQREALLLEVATASATAHSTWKADQDSLLQVSCIAIVQHKYGLIYSCCAGNNGRIAAHHARHEGSMDQLTVPMQCYRWCTLLHTCALIPLRHTDHIPGQQTTHLCHLRQCCRAILLHV